MYIKVIPWVNVSLYYQELLKQMNFFEEQFLEGVFKPFEENVDDQPIKKSKRRKRSMKGKENIPPKERVKKDSKKTKGNNLCSIFGYIHVYV